MKTIIKKTLILAFFLSNVLMGICQIADWQELIAKDMLENAPYIIEGEVLEFEGYRMETNNAIKTSHLVKIYKIFRGSDLPAEALKCGTVEVITQGGVIVENGVEVDWADHSVSPSGPLKVGTKGLMLLYPTTAQSLNRSTTNSVKLFLSPGPSIYFYKTYVGSPKNSTH